MPSTPAGTSCGIWKRPQAASTGDPGVSKTLFMLMAAHDGKPVLPVDVVCREYFAPLTLPVFLRKVQNGDIALPLIKMERSQKGARLIHLEDLAAYIDAQREAAKRGREA